MATDFNRQNAFNITDRRRFLKNISVVSAAFATTDLWTMSAAGQENMSFVNSGAVPRRAFVEWKSFKSKKKIIIQPKNRCKLTFAEIGSKVAETNFYISNNMRS